MQCHVLLGITKKETDLYQLRRERVGMYANSVFQMLFIFSLMKSMAFTYLAN